MHEKREGIYAFLRRIDAIRVDEDVKDVVKRMKIGFNKFKEQVVIECVSAEKAEQVFTPLQQVPALDRGLGYGITSADANFFRDDRVPIFISWVRSSIDIEKYLIDGFLSNYGEVLSHKPVLDREGVETFEHVFLMWQKDIAENPPPNFFWLGKNKLKVRYKGQIETCWICDMEGHKAFECPRKIIRENNTVTDTVHPCAICNQTDHMVDKCRFYSDKQLAEYRRDYPLAFEEARKKAIAEGHSLYPAASLIAPSTSGPMEITLPVATSLTDNAANDTGNAISPSPESKVNSDSNEQESANTTNDGKTIGEDKSAATKEGEVPEKIVTDDVANDGENNAKQEDDSRVSQKVVVEEEEDIGPSAKKLKKQDYSSESDSEFFGFNPDMDIDDSTENIEKPPSDPPDITTRVSDVD